eukprot:TRINITY_DN7132_c0_g1_i2.p1 TRINITY_DN7132_c0_g1~~TRINITY_DN7132_c0_g1_i2.p1  ORF type:complete len:239 (+),score=76.77 TRINITY_DN7132_c0_g1_i2:143-859(+)
MSGVGEPEDPFADFLSKEAEADAPVAAAPELSPPAALPVQAAPVSHVSEDADSALQWKLLLDSSLRREQHLGKLCSLLVGLDEKVARLSSNQDRLEAQLQHAMSQSPTSAPPTTSFSNTPAATNVSITGAVPPPPTSSARQQQRKEEEERKALERYRVEEESRRRAEEIRRKREESEREAEKQRIEDERRREEERQRKIALEKKTEDALSGLFGAGGGNSLFGEEPVKKKKGGGLFDD